MSNRNWSFAAIAFLAVQAGMVAWVAGSERLPSPPALDQFPSTLGTWNKSFEDHLDPPVLAQLQADRLVSWNYLQTGTGVAANWFVAWFQSQRTGAQPHSPKVCLPGNGWIPQVTDEVPIDTTAGTITANRYIVSLGGSRAVVLYWFQTPRRALASEWSAKFWLVADAVRDHRTDTALARVVVYETGGRDTGQSDAAATSAAVQFAENAYPALRDALSGAPPPPGTLARSVPALR